MGRITKAQNYAVRWLHSQSMSESNIATELNLSIKQVKGVIEKSGDGTNNVNNIKTAQEPVKQESLGKKLMMNSTANNKSGVNMMTGAASQTFQETKPTPNVRDTSSYMRKIFE